MSFIQRLINGIPKHKKDVWYNQSNNMSDRKYPIIFDKNKKYIDCKIGLEVIMDITKDGKNVYYKVTKIRKTKGSDWLYPSDAINCDLVFSKICNNR
jgi:hypothetical protein